MPLLFCSCLTQVYKLVFYEKTLWISVQLGKATVSNSCTLFRREENGLSKVALSKVKS